MSPFRALTPEQQQSFLDNGYLVVEQCLDPDVIQRWVAEGFERLGYDPHDPATWAEEIIWMKYRNEMPVRELAPRAWDTILDLVGGEDRLETRSFLPPEEQYPMSSFNWSDGFIANFRRGADRPWQPPSPEAGGWHKDGGSITHFLDSPEQALLTIVLWTDMRHRGGATFVSPDSVRPVARCLAENPQGFTPTGFDFPALLSQCSRFEELTGLAGDVVILHPFILHASSQNVLGVPRLITNPAVLLKEPMNFNRPNPADFSPLERATLHYLGVDRFDFKAAAPRKVNWRVKEEEPDP
jgi:hypothetical protein